MSNKRIDGGGTVYTGNFASLLANYIGETVTILQAVGDSQVQALQGVVLSVNPVYVRLITRIGPPQVAH